ncbi:hypothetical protein U9M48_041640 [Paspalum notatum var. saurae]|uniref:Disease resistance N-terminal domain-containing protein n=1 Tax=Paspalum notatum var. saurae TaxID=547442 RepID=A0AAQ3XED6_PASNO
MAVGASTRVMSSLLSKLSVLLSDQYKQLKGVRRDIEFLSRELTDMNAALEDLADMEKLDAQTKAWRDKVREMAYDIEDVIDVFMHHHAQQGGDDKGGLLNKASRKIRKLRVRLPPCRCGGTETEEEEAHAGLLSGAGRRESVQHWGQRLGG